jgi:hypothetical protein
MYGDDERCIQVLVGKPTGKRQFGRPRCGLENNTKVYLQGGMGDRDWTDRFTVGTGGLL